MVWIRVEAQITEQFTDVWYLLMTEPAGLTNAFELKGREKIPKFCQLLRWKISKDK